MGALGEDGVRVINDEVVRTARVTREELARVEARERMVLERRAWRYRGEREPVRLEGRTVVIVDDDVATGSTARAARRIARARGAARIVLAVPVAPPGWTARLGGEAHELICLDTPRDFHAIGQFYAPAPQPRSEGTGTAGPFDRDRVARGGKRPRLGAFDAADGAKNVDPGKGAQSVVRGFHHVRERNVRSHRSKGVFR